MMLCIIMNNILYLLIILYISNKKYFEILIKNLIYTIEITLPIVYTKHHNI